jgi:hypothetical protein
MGGACGNHGKRGEMSFVGKIQGMRQLENLGIDRGKN